MPEHLSFSTEAKALIREPRRNKEVIKGKLLNLLQPVRDIMLGLRARHSLPNLLQERQQSHEKLAALEQRVLAEVEELRLQFLSSVDQVNTKLKTDPALPEGQAPLSPAEIEQVLEGGWSLYAGEIDFQQISAAVDNSYTQVPIFTEAGEATQQSARIFDPMMVNAELAQFGGRDVVFELDYAPKTNSGDQYVKFFSPDAGTVLSDEVMNGGSVRFELRLDQQQQLQYLESPLEPYSQYVRKSTLQTPMPEIRITRLQAGNPELKYLNIVNSDHMKKWALELLLDKIAWAKYALANIGKEYYARANATRTAASQERPGMYQSVASTFFDADGDTLRQKLEHYRAEAEQREAWRKEWNQLGPGPEDGDTGIVW